MSIKKPVSPMIARIVRLSTMRRHSFTLSRAQNATSPDAATFDSAHSVGASGGLLGLARGHPHKLRSGRAALQSATIRQPPRAAGHAQASATSPGLKLIMPWTTSFLVLSA